MRSARVPMGSARAERSRRAPHVAALVFAVSFGACAGGTHRDQHVAPVEQLTSEDVALYGALLAATDAEHADPALVQRALASRSRAVRIEAVRVIGQVHARDLARALRRGLTDRDTAVAATAAFAIGLLKDTGSISALAGALGGPPTVGVEAAWALGEIGSPASEAIEGAIKARRVPGSTLATLVRATAALQPVPVALDAVLVAPSAAADGRVVAPASSSSAKHLDGEASSEALLVRATAYALSRHPDAGAVRTLASLASSSDPVTRMYSARGLIKRVAGDSLASIARGALTSLTHDTVAHVRAVAVQSLSTFGQPARAQILAALRDSDENVRVAAAGILDRVLGPSRGEWHAAFAADTSLAVRRGVVAGALRSGVVLEAIDHDNPDRWQRSGDWRYRAAVAEAGEGTPIGRIVQVVLPLTRDPDGRVRAAAYGVFVPWVDSADAAHHPWRRTYLYDSIHDPDPIVRATALGALDSSATARDGALALDSYRRATRDSLADARLAALELMNAAWRRDSAQFSDSLRTAIQHLRPSDDPRELDAVGSGSLWKTWQRAREGRAPPHPQAWYDSVTRAVVLPALAGHELRVTITTVRGPLVIALAGREAPLTVANFVALAREGFYDRTAFHRVVPAFVAQDGDPRGDGNGGPPYAIRDELNRLRYERGVLGMALSGPDTGGSQYFLTLTPQPHLDGHYTAFGRLVTGAETLDALVQGDSITRVIVQ